MKLEIEGRIVEVDDSFKTMTPEQQEATVNEIAQSFGVSQKKAQIPNNSAVGQFNNSVAGALDVLRTPAALMDMGVNKISNALTGENLLPEPRSTAEVFRGMDIAVADQPPETVMQGLGKGAGVAAASYAPVVGGLNALRSSLTNPTALAVIDDAIKALSGVGGLGAEVAAGGLSGAAGRGAEQAGYPELAPIAEVVGGAAALPGALATGKVGASVAGQVASKLPITGAAIRTGRDVRAALTPMTEGGARQVARNEVQARAGGADRATELAAQIDPKDEFGRTAAQQTGDPNLMGLERAAMDENPVLREALTAQRGKSVESLTRAVDDMGGDVEDAREHFTRMIDDAIAGANIEVSRAGPRDTEASNSVNVVNRLKTALDEAVTQERYLWQSVPKGEEVPTDGAREATKFILEDLPRAQQRDFPPILRQLLVDEGGFSDTETVAEMHGLYSELRRVARSAMAGNDQNKNVARIANEVADAILEDLGTLNPDSDVGAAVNKARAFSAELHQKFDQGAVGRMLKRTIDGDEVTTPEAALDRTVGRGGSIAGADDAKIREAAAAAGENVQDYLRSRFSESIFDASGKFTATKARTWLRSNRETLEAYPDLRAELTRALQGRDAAQALSVRADIKDFNSGKAGEAVQSILGASKPAATARDIVAEARKDTTGKALAGVKGAFSDYLSQNVEKMPGIMSDKQFRAAISQVFDGGEMARLRQIADATRRMNVDPKEAGGVIDAPVNKLLEAVIRIAAAKAATRMSSGGNAGVDLQTAQLASSRAANMLRNMTNGRAREILNDAVKDPKLMRELLMEPDSWVNGIGKKSQSRLAPYIAGAASNMGEE